MGPKHHILAAALHRPEAAHPAAVLPALRSQAAAHRAAHPSRVTSLPVLRSQAAAQPAAHPSRVTSLPAHRIRTGLHPAPGHPLPGRLRAAPRRPGHLPPGPQRGRQDHSTNSLHARSPAPPD
jgi:hypothetical protein